MLAPFLFLAGVSAPCAPGDDDDDDDGNDGDDDHEDDDGDDDGHDATTPGAHRRADPLQKHKRVQAKNETNYCLILV